MDEHEVTPQHNDLIAAVWAFLDSEDDPDKVREIVDQAIQTFE